MKKFKILCVLLLVFILAGIAQGLFVDFVGGLNISSKFYNLAEEMKTKYHSVASVNVTLKDNAILDFNEVNVLNNDSIILVPKDATLFVPVDEDNSQFYAEKGGLSKIVTVSLSILIILIDIILFWFFIRIIIVFTRKDFFDRRITKWLSYIGYAFISLSILLTAWYLVKTYTITQAFELTYFNIDYGAAIDFSNFTTGLIILLVNEILKSAKQIKRENDLTI